MKPIPYVSEASLLKAREIEDRFKTLPPDAGILFVGVSPTPSESGGGIGYTVYLGVARYRDTETVENIFIHVMDDEFEKGELVLSTVIIDGVLGSAREKLD